MTPLALACALAGAVLVIATLASHRSLARTLGAPTGPVPERASWPSLTIVRPIKGLDVGARANLEALFAASYPGELEILLVLDDTRDAAFTLARDQVELHKARGHRAELLLAGAPPSGRTGKLHAMLVGFARAQGELVAFNDSDTRPTPELWRRLVDALATHPRGGAAFAPVVAVPEREMSAGDFGYALLLNGWYGPAAVRAGGVRGELPFIMGQAMIFTRPAIDAIGGLTCADGHFVDDMWLGTSIARAGLANLQIDAPLAVVIGGMKVGTFLRTFRRWLLFSEGGLPPTFLHPQWLRGGLYGLTLLATIVPLAGGALLGVVMPLVALGAFGWSEVALHRARGGTKAPLGHLWVALVLPLAGALVALSTLLVREVDWRGRTYALDGKAHLASPAARPPGGRSPRRRTARPLP